MKMCILIISLFFCCFILQAQQIEVIFEEKESIANDYLADIEDVSIRLAVQQSLTQPKQYRLLTNQKESSYVVIKDDKELEVGGLTVVQNGGEDAIFKNHINQEQLRQREFLGRQFLIEDVVMDAKQWMVTKEQTKILDYLCIKAMHITAEKDTITAWFSPQLPMKDGPNRYSGLSGLILKVESPKKVIVATSVQIKQEEETIIAPTKGKKMSTKAFKDMVDKKMAQWK